jgi:Na+-transporting methylmalonyl-CoA/oxaloacetate decarboxylase gamma subunit
MDAGVVLLLLVLLVFVVVAVGVLSAVRAGLWARETGPTAAEPGEGGGGRPRHLVEDEDTDEAGARVDTGSRDRDAARR